MTKVLKIKKKINKSIGSNAFDIFNFIILTLFMLSILYPLVFIFSVSLSDRLSVLKNEVFIFPIGANLESYRKIFQEDLFVHSYFNTILYTVLGTLACVIINALTAYPLSKKRLKGGTFVMMAITFTMLFSGGLIPYYLLIRNLGMIDTIWVLIIPGALVPMYVIIMRTFFQNLPPELEESAEIDGCNDFQTFIRIIIPLSKPVMATISLFAAVASWNSYFSPLIFLNTQEKFPLQLFLRSILITNEFSSLGNIEVGSAAVMTTSLKYSAIIVSIIPMIIIYPFIQKFFVKGMMVGSIKG